MRLALGKVDSSPFGPKEITQLKADVVASLHGLGLQLKTSTEDSPDVLLDYRFLELLLAAAHDPDVSIGSFAAGVRVGPGVRLPRLPALYKAKKSTGAVRVRPSRTPGRSAGHGPDLEEELPCSCYAVRRSHGGSRGPRKKRTSPKVEGE